MNYNDNNNDNDNDNNEDIEHLSLAYSNIEKNIPDYIIVNPHYKKYIITSQNIYFNKENYNHTIIEISNQDIQPYINNLCYTICWVIILFLSVLSIVTIAMYSI